MLESPRENPDDAEDPAREPDRAAHNTGVAAKAPHPQRVTEHYDVAVALNLIGRLELPAERRLESEELEESCGDAHTPQLFGLVNVTKLHVGAQVRSNALERLELGAVVTKISRRHRKMWAGRRLLKEPYKTFGIGVRQRRENDALHSAENRRVGANGQRQCQHRCNGKAGRPPQKPDRIAKIL